MKRNTGLKREKTWFEVKNQSIRTTAIGVDQVT